MLSIQAILWIVGDKVKRDTGVIAVIFYTKINENDLKHKSK
jgi:hypothetical protein